MNRHIVRSCAVVAALAIHAAWLPAELVAAEYAGYAWPDAGTRILAGYLCGNCEGTEEHPDWRDEFESAAMTWNDRTRFFELTTGRGRQGQACSSSGPNRASFRSNACGDAFGFGTLAVTVTWRDGSVPSGFRKPDHVELVFNSARDWSVYDGPLRAEEDFRRVAAHELGHVMGLAHSDDWRSLLATVISTATTPQPDDLSGVAELYGDNRREFVDLLGPSQSRIAMLRLMPERWFRAEVRSAADGELLSTVPFLGASYAPVELVALNGLLDNGADALGLLTRHRETGAIVFQWRDAVTGERLGNIYFLGTDYLPVDVAFVADAGGTGRAGIALLAMSGDGKATLVQTRFLDTGEVMSNVYFAAGELSPRRLHLPGDTDGNGVPDYSVLADRPEDGRILVQTRNSIGEPEASTVFFLGDYHDVIDSEVLPGAGATPTALAVLARRTYDRKIVVQRRNLRGDPQPVSSFFLTRLYKPRSLAIIDTPADGRQYVVLARNYDSGGVLAQAKRVADNLSTHVELFFEPGIVPTDLRVLNDQGLFVLGYRGGDDATLGQVRNLADGATVNVNFTREF